MSSHRCCSVLGLVLAVGTAGCQGRIATLNYTGGFEKAILQQGADDLGRRGTDPFYGKGRINVIETVRH